MLLVCSIKVRVKCTHIYSHSAHVFYYVCEFLFTCVRRLVHSVKISCLPSVPHNPKIIGQLEGKYWLVHWTQVNKQQLPSISMQEYKFVDNLETFARRDVCDAQASKQRTCNVGSIGLGEIVKVFYICISVCLSKMLRSTVSDAMLMFN